MADVVLNKKCCFYIVPVQDFQKPFRIDTGTIIECQIDNPAGRRNVIFLRCRKLVCSRSAERYIRISACQTRRQQLFHSLLMTVLMICIFYAPSKKHCNLLNKR